MKEKERELLEELKIAFAKERDIIALYLFGSATTNLFSTHSDIDLAILLEEPFNYRRTLLLSAQASLILKKDNIDLLALNTTPLFLTYRILREGKLLFCQDEEIFSNFVESILQQYFDFKPDLESYYQDFQYSFKKAYGNR